MLVFLTGRKTGRSSRQPVSYVRDGQTLLTPGGGKWKLHLIEGRAVRIRLLGRDIRARPEIAGDLDEVQRLYGVMTAIDPMVTRFVDVPRSPDGQLDRSRLETAVHHGFRIVRWHPEEPAEAHGR
ncbi:MAG: PNPOx family protein [Solirubrobacteraceae bacterium]